MTDRHRLYDSSICLTITGEAGRLHAVPSMDIIEPLSPDACTYDPAAPCYYLHLKLRALNGDAGDLVRRTDDSSF